MTPTASALAKERTKSGTQQEIVYTTTTMQTNNINTQAKQNTPGFGVEQVEVVHMYDQATGIQQQNE